MLCSVKVVLGEAQAYLHAVERLTQGQGHSNRTVLMCACITPLASSLVLAPAGLLLHMRICSCTWSDAHDAFS